MDVRSFCGKGAWQQEHGPKPPCDCFFLATFCLRLFLAAKATCVV
jgi:hypothetical protein